MNPQTCAGCLGLSTKKHDGSWLCPDCAARLEPGLPVGPQVAAWQRQLIAEALRDLGVHRDDKE